MKRVKLVVAYDGSAYHGWQNQPNAITVEGVLNQALSKLLQEDVAVVSSSRTDTGVHSLGNIAVFDTNTKIPCEKISYALNQRLPEDIVIQSSCEVALDFHPRYCKSQKTYEYHILNRRMRLPLLRNQAYFYHYPLDFKKMSQAAKYFIGEHDFASFCSAGSAVETTVRTIYALDISVNKISPWGEITSVSCKDATFDLTQGAYITLRITGSGFLYNMVRIIAGTLLQVGIGEKQPEDIKKILETKDRKMAGPTAPAVGLCMIGIEYL